MNNTPIFITGIPRSGISITAGMIDANDVFGGNINNRYSNKQITEEILDPYFVMLGDITCQSNVPFSDDLPEIFGLRDRVLDFIEKQGYMGGRWYIKDARLILIHSILDEAFPEADWLIVKRDKSEITQSCMKTNYMNAYKDIKGWSNWVDKWNKIITGIESVNFNIIEVFPTAFIDGDYTEINNVLKELELKEY